MDSLGNVPIFLTQPLHQEQGRQVKTTVGLGNSQGQFEMSKEYALIFFCYYKDFNAFYTSYIHV